MVVAEDGTPIHSQRIRYEEIDIHGTLLMPAPLRSVLEKPLGKILDDKEFRSSIQSDHDAGIRIVTIGDKTTDRALMIGVPMHTAIIDGQTQRQPHVPQSDQMKTFSLHPQCGVSQGRAIFQILHL